MSVSPVIQLKEFHGRRAVCFSACDHSPEQTAWDQMRRWAAKNKPDHAARTYVGYAPKGHHPEGEEHGPGEAAVKHEYAALMLLFEGEEVGDLPPGAEICDAPAGLFLVGDVLLTERNPDGTADIGSSMEKSSSAMFAFIKETGIYRFALDTRPYYEEHIFPAEWFGGAEAMADMKLWLPIERI